MISLPAEVTGLLCLAAVAPSFILQSPDEVIITQFNRYIYPPGTVRPRGAPLPAGTIKVYDEYAVRLSEELKNAPLGVPPAHMHFQLVITEDSGKKYVNFTNRIGNIPALECAAVATLPRDNTDIVVGEPYIIVTIGPESRRRHISPPFRHPVFRASAGKVLYVELRGNAEPNVTYAMRRQTQIENGKQVTRYFLTP